MKYALLFFFIVLIGCNNKDDIQVVHLKIGVEDFPKSIQKQFDIKSIANKVLDNKPLTKIELVNCGFDKTWKITCDNIIIDSKNKTLLYKYKNYENKIKYHVMFIQDDFVRFQDASDGLPCCFKAKSISYIDK